MTQPAPPPDPRIARDRLVRRVLTAAGLSEAVTFGFIEAKAGRRRSRAADGRSAVVAIANPLSAKFDTLRPSLAARPGRRRRAQPAPRPARRRGCSRSARASPPRGETRGVGARVDRRGGAEHWSGGARDVDFFDVKGRRRAPVRRRSASRPRFEPAREPYLVAGQTARSSSLRRRRARRRRRPASRRRSPTRAALPRQDRVFVAELDLDRARSGARRGADAARAAAALSVRRARPLDRRRRHLACGNHSWHHSAAGARLPAPLTAIAFFDRYQGKGVPEGSVSLSVRLTFQAADRTLTDAEVQQSVRHDSRGARARARRGAAITIRDHGQIVSTRRRMAWRRRRRAAWSSNRSIGSRRS